MGAKAAPGLLQPKLDVLEVWMVETGAIMTPQVMAALDRERPQGSSGKVPVNCTPEVAVAVFSLHSGSLAARAAVAPGLALA